MTTEELLRLIKALAKNHPAFTDDGEKKCLELIEQAKSEWCKAQRGNCVKAYYDSTDEKGGSMICILNSPGP